MWVCYIELYQAYWVKALRFLDCVPLSSFYIMAKFWCLLPVSAFDQIQNLISEAGSFLYHSWPRLQFLFGANIWVMIWEIIYKSKKYVPHTSSRVLDKCWWQLLTSFDCFYPSTQKVHSVLLQNLIGQQAVIWYVMRIVVAKVKSLFFQFNFDNGYILSKEFLQCFFAQKDCTANAYWIHAIWHLFHIRRIAAFYHFFWNVPKPIVQKVVKNVTKKGTLTLSLKSVGTQMVFYYYNYCL